MTTSWDDLFERAADYDVTLERIRSADVPALEGRGTDDAGTDGDGDATGQHGDRPDTDRPNPARVVADPAVLAADLFVDGDARVALDHVRRHSWVDLVASDALCEQTERVVADLADGGSDLARAHRERLEAERVRVDQPAGDHPALASAYRGNAAHLLSSDEQLSSAKAGLTLQPRLSVSVRPPDAFARLFDPESLYEAVEEGAYPGPDRDPRG